MTPKWHPKPSKIREKGNSVSVISVHTIKPLDEIGIQNILKNHKKVWVVEEHVPHGGLSSRVKNIAWNVKANCKLDVMTLQDKFIHFYGNHQDLLACHGIEIDKIISKSI